MVSRCAVALAITDCTSDRSCTVHTTPKNLGANLGKYKLRKFRSSRQRQLETSTLQIPALLQQSPVSRQPKDIEEYGLSYTRQSKHHFWWQRDKQQFQHYQQLDGSSGQKWQQNSGVPQQKLLSRPANNWMHEELNEKIIQIIVTKLCY